MNTDSVELIGSSKQTFKFRLVSILRRLDVTSSSTTLGADSSVSDSLLTPSIPVLRHSVRTAWVIVGTILCLAAAETALGQAINYSDTKNWQFTSSVRGANPVIAGQRFTHAMDSSGNLAVWTGGQNAMFDGFESDNAEYVPDPKNGNFKTLSLTNLTKPPVAITPELLPNLGIGATNDTSTAGDASATTNFNVNQNAMTRNGSLTVSGQAPNRGYAFSYGSVAATVNGKNLNGTATVRSSGLRVTSRPPTKFRGYRSGAGVKDPLNLTVADVSGNVMLEQTLFLSTAEVDGGGSISWDSGLLNMNADTSTEDAYFEVDVSPLSSAPSTLMLRIVDGSLVSETASGPIFGSLTLPALGSIGDFSLMVPDDFTFGYDTSQFANQNLTVTAEWDTAGYLITPEPSTLAMLGSGVLSLACLLRRQRLPHKNRLANRR
jgi:hypothetical protein